MSTDLTCTLAPLMETEAGGFVWCRCQLSSGDRASRLLEPAEEALEGAQGILILTGLEFGAVC